MVSMARFVTILALALLVFSGCKVSLTGASIPADVTTFTIYNFTNQSPNGSAILQQNLTDALKEKFVTETNLKQVERNGDIEFKGVVTGYEIEGKAPTGNETSALNRLILTVKVEYINHKDESANWVTSFSRFADYESTVNLATVESQLLSDINSQLTQDIFNKALVNW